MIRDLRNIVIVLFISVFNVCGQLNPAGKFASVGVWKCTNGSSFDLNKVNTPTVVFFGFAKCPPCRVLIQILADVTTERKYKGYNFVYVTFDSIMAINEELNAVKTPGYENFKTISVSKDYIQAHNLASGYPTVYFLNSDKTISHIEIGPLLMIIKG